MSWLPYSQNFSSVCRVATARYCFSRAEAFSPNTGIDTTPNPYLRYPLQNCTFWGSQPWLPYSLFAPVYIYCHSLYPQQSSSRQVTRQIGCCRAIIDFSTGDFKLNRQAITINVPIDLRGIPRTAFFG